MTSDGGRSDRLGARYLKLATAAGVSNLGDGVGLVAFPWLASATTRNGLLIAVVVVVQRLPWLVFSLAAGVIADRYDRRRLMVGASLFRAGLSLAVAAVVFARSDRLGLDPGALGQTQTDLVLYGVVLAATFGLGMAEVISDNTAQTFLPTVVEPHLLERANGRMWSIEQVANALVGPALGAVLLSAAFATPFLFDTTTSLVAAALIGSIGGRPLANKTAPKTPDESTLAKEQIRWRREIGTGFKWLWDHTLIRDIAIIIGIMNLVGVVANAALVLFVQDVIGVGARQFGFILAGAAIGGIVAGWTSPSVITRLGPGAALTATLAISTVSRFVIGLSSSWVVVLIMLGLNTYRSVLWNVVTVSLRQGAVPNELLGRVNSVYRLISWGTQPVGALISGLIIVAASSWADRDLALRLPWLVAGVAQLAVLVVVAPRLTSTRLNAARHQG